MRSHLVIFCQIKIITYNIVKSLKTAKCVFEYQIVIFFLIQIKFLLGFVLETF